MGLLVNAGLGILFVVVAVAATFLMFYLWKFPYDHDALTSEAPRSLVRLHRLLGYLYVGIYVYFLWVMVPRLWNYQIEFPARTVVHFTMALLIGGILLVKVAVIRFFKHMESKLLPPLGTALLLCTVVLIGLSVPFALQQRLRGGMGSSNRIHTKENRQRVRKLLRETGLRDENRLNEYTSSRGLEAGERVLTGKCIQCHDLRTALIRPRTAAGWRSLVARMGERSHSVKPITETEEWQVTAYLIAVSPHLQAARQKQKKRENDAQRCRNCLDKINPVDVGRIDEVRAAQLVRTKCAQCHGLENLERTPPRSFDDAKRLVGRMIEEGFTATDEEIRLIVLYLAEKYGRRQ